VANQYQSVLFQITIVIHNAYNCLTASRMSERTKNFTTTFCIIFNVTDNNFNKVLYWFGFIGTFYTKQVRSCFQKVCCS